MDDMYPNNGEFFTIHEPKDQVEERIKSKAKATAGKSIIEDLIKKRKADIDHYGKIASVEIDFATDPDAHRQLMFARGEFVKLLESDLQYLEGLLVE